MFLSAVPPVPGKASLPMRLKQHLTTRLAPELLDRLQAFSDTMRAPIPEVISRALDALEGQETLARHLESIERRFDFLLDLTSGLEEKMDQASVNEKERLKSLLQLLKAEMQAHDEAEERRFERLR